MGSRPVRRDSRLAWSLLVVSVVLLIASGAAALAGFGSAAVACLVVVNAAGLVPAVTWVVASLRAGRLGADLIAVLALLGTLLIGEPLAGAVVALMLATGRVLEARAAQRATRQLAALRDRTPAVAHRLTECGPETVPVAALTVGDLIVVERGEVVPVDGQIEQAPAVLDESALTGESLPRSRPVGDLVRSGVLNAGDVFAVRVARAADASTYAGVVRLVEIAQAAAETRFVRIADRWAALFLGLTVGVAGAAWLLTGESRRAVAVLVVASPCPLILAVPIAITAGLSQAASIGVVVRDGIHLERLAEARILLLDKTGTLTRGRPRLAHIAPVGDHRDDEVLRMAASLDQVSAHVLARATVAAARDGALALTMPTDVTEQPGRGIRGMVDGRRVAVGRADWVAPDTGGGWTRPIRRRADLDGALSVFVAIDGVPAGGLLFDDPIRPDAARTIRAIRQRGITQVVLVSGDRADVAGSVGVLLGVDDVLAERSPSDKVDDVITWRAVGPTIMVGDGINDAPALASADVGVAIVGSGGSAASEAADVAVVSDRFDRLEAVIGIAQRTRQIARQSAWLGMGLSLVGVVAAAAGRLPPLAGAIAQEGIDVLAILSALRAVRPPRASVAIDAHERAIFARFAEDHRRLRPRLAAIRIAADRLSAPSSATALDEVRAVHRFLVEEIGPHELAEGAQLYPLVERLTGARSTETMARAHAEIVHQIRRLGRFLADVGDEPLDDVEIGDLRRLLYGIDALLTLHFTQEDEAYLTTRDDSPTPADTAALPAPS